MNIRFNLTNLFKCTYLANKLLIISYCLNFNDYSVIRIVDAAATDRADEQKKKTNGRGEENRKIRSWRDILVVT
jgi:hypothetical protein